MKIRDYIDSALVLTALVLSLALCHTCNRQSKVLVADKIIRDTTFVRVVDTVVVLRPQPTLILPIRDTIILIDSVKVEVPVVSNVYSDSSYRCKVSGGYFVNLDEIEIYKQKEYIHTTSTNVVYKKPIISLIAGVGVGYNPINHNASPIIGLSIGIPIWSHYGKKN